MAKEIKRKLEYLEQHRDYSPLDFFLKREIRKLLRDDQIVNYTVNSSKGSSSQGPSNKGSSSQGPSGQVLSTTSQPFSTMANRYAPLALPANLNAMPIDYSSKIK